MGSAIGRPDAVVGSGPPLPAQQRRASELGTYVVEKGNPLTEIVK
jgi:hypothetical protein